MKSLYETLGLLPTADDVVIKAAYKALAQKYHPDKNKAIAKPGTPSMEEINAAYAALRTRALRQAYDAKLATQQKRAAKRQSTAAAKDTQQELIKKIKRNAIDEMGLITLFEEFFKCRVQVRAGWMNSYSTAIDNEKMTLDFISLKTKIIEHLEK